MKNTMFIWSHQGEFLYDDCFELSAINSLIKDIEHYSNKKAAKALIKELESYYKDIKLTEDHLCQLYQKFVTVDSELADRLKLFDIIHPECFTSDYLIGDGIIESFIHAELCFIVEKIVYKKKDEIRFNFRACNRDFDDECLHLMLSNKISTYF